MDTSNCRFSLPDASLMAFTFKPKGPVLPYPENRKIYIVGSDGKEKFIANGVNPMFSPDGKSLLVLKKRRPSSG